MRLTLFALCLTLSAAPALAGVGATDTRLTDRTDRPLTLRIWYPTDHATSPEKIGETRIFYGLDGVWNAPARPAPAPLIVLSHGSGGNLTNQGWLASALAAEGMIVATLNHPGTTSGDNRPPGASKLWERPQDIRRIIDAALKPGSPILPKGAAVDPTRIGVIGHSLGAFTALWIAGGRFDPARLATHCRDKPHFAACTVATAYQLPDTPEGQAHLAADYRDPRVRAVVSLDIGLANAFSPESLAAIAQPVLLVPADQPNPLLPPAEETGYLRAHLAPKVRAELAPQDASHFSFLATCKPGAEALIAAVEPGDEIICRDGPGQNRDSLHQFVAAGILSFLRAAGF